MTEQKSFEIDKEKFGAFVAQLRKAQGLTQKELAAQLYVSDKAVSKWERSLSLPDVVLLQPLADVLGVTVAELLECERSEQTEATEQKQQTEEEAETYLSVEEVETRKQRSKRWNIVFLVATAMVCVELLLLLLTGHTLQQLLEETLLVLELLFLLFDGYFCYRAKDVLPEYYDKYHICSYSDGAFRINIPVRISNRNWGAMLQAIRLSLTSVTIMLPLFYWFSYQIGATIWNTYVPVISIVICLIAFAPMIIVAKKYE